MSRGNGRLSGSSLGGGGGGGDASSGTNTHFEARILALEMDLQTANSQLAMEREQVSSFYF